MKFSRIDRQLLSTMQEILNESTGYEVSMADEMEFFNPSNSQGWTLATDFDGQQVGLLRYFKQASTWTLGELFVKLGVESRNQIAHKLLAELTATTNFPTAHRLRFDVLANDTELNEALEAAGFSQERQWFRHFECADMPFANSMAIQESVSLSDASEVAEALSNLHPVDKTGAESWIQSGSIRVVRDDRKIVAAAQIFESSSTVEINRFATHADFLRRGYGAELLSNIVSEFQERDGRKLYLKVEDIRKPAIRLYESVGFTEVVEKSQYWHSRWF